VKQDDFLASFFGRNETVKVNAMELQKLIQENNKHKVEINKLKEIVDRQRLKICSLQNSITIDLVV